MEVLIRVQALHKIVNLVRGKGALVQGGKAQEFMFDHRQIRINWHVRDFLKEYATLCNATQSHCEHQRHLKYS